MFILHVKLRLKDYRELIANQAKSYGHKNVIYVPAFEDINNALLGILKENDMLITIGQEVFIKFQTKY